MNDVEKSYISCLSATEAPGMVPAGKVTCDVCKADCWISPSMLPHIASGELTPICLDCTPGIVRTHSPGDMEFMLHPDQEEELRDLGLLERARAAVAKLNRAQGERARGQ